VALLEGAVKSDRREFRRKCAALLTGSGSGVRFRSEQGKFLTHEGFQVAARHLLAQHVGDGGAGLGGRHVHDLRRTGNQCAANSAAALKATRTSTRMLPTFRSVDSSVGIRPRSEQSVTSGACLPVVHVSPKRGRVVHVGGSQRGSQASTFTAPESGCPI
jgi:hypothetical protein